MPMKKDAKYYEDRIEELRAEYKANPHNLEVFKMRKRLLEIAKERAERREIA